MSSIQEDVCFVLGFVVFSILVGIVGFRLFSRQGWYDSLCCATLALGGNYQMKLGQTGLLFSSLYTLYGSIIFFVIAGIVINRLYLGLDSRMHQQVIQPEQHKEN